MKPGFEGDDAYACDFSHFNLAAAFLGKGYEGAILGFEFGECVLKCVKLFAVHACGFVGDFKNTLLGFKGRGKTLPALAPDVVDASVAREAKEPCFKLCRLIKTWKGPDHLDKNDLGEVLDGVAAVEDAVNEPGNAMLVREYKSALGIFVALLCLADGFRKRGCIGNVIARVCIVVRGLTIIRLRSCVRKVWFWCVQCFVTADAGDVARVIVRRWAVEGENQMAANRKFLSKIFCKKNVSQSVANVEKVNMVGGDSPEGFPLGYVS